MNEYAAYAREIARAAEGVDEKAEAAAEDAGRYALAIAESRAPVLTGRLRSELRIRQRGAIVAVESPTPYAVFVEYGTSDTPPHPFIGPAFVGGEARLVREVEQIRDDVVKDLS